MTEARLARQRSSHSSRQYSLPEQEVKVRLLSILFFHLLVLGKAHRALLGLLDALLSTLALYVGIVVLTLDHELSQGLRNDERIAVATVEPSVLTCLETRHEEQQLSHLEGLVLCSDGTCDVVDLFLAQLLAVYAQEQERGLEDVKQPRCRRTLSVGDIEPDERRGIAPEDLHRVLDDIVHPCVREDVTQLREATIAARYLRSPTRSALQFCS